jgi:hypothetical protein
MVSNSIRSDAGPAALSLSPEKLKVLHPELFSTNGWKKFMREHGYRLASQNEDPESWKTYISEYLYRGDARAAVVIGIAPLLIAAYAGELDCIAMLKFDRKIERAYKLQAGQRLLAIDTYLEWNFFLPHDLTPGPNASGRFRNFAPFIAEFLSENHERIDELKTGIREAEWNMADAAGRSYLETFGPVARDGRSLLCHLPAQK